MVCRTGCSATKRLCVAISLTICSTYLDLRTLSLLTKPFVMAWNEPDNGYIKEGELVVDLESIRGWGKEVQLQNRGKWGRPFRYPEALIMLGGLIKTVFSLPNRETEVLLKALSGFVGTGAPDHTTIARRVSKLKLPIDGEAKSGLPVTIALDSNGVSVMNTLEHGETQSFANREMLKLYVAVDTRKRRILDLKVSHIGNHYEEIAQVPVIIEAPV